LERVRNGVELNDLRVSRWIEKQKNCEQGKPRAVHTRSSSEKYSFRRNNRGAPLFGLHEPGKESPVPPAGPVGHLSFNSLRPRRNDRHRASRYLLEPR